MTITFGPLTTTDTAGTGRSRLVLGPHGRGFAYEVVGGDSPGVGRSRVVLRSYGQGTMEEEVGTPIIPAHGRSAVYIGTSGVGAEAINVDGDGTSTIRIGSRGYGLDIAAGDTPAAGRSHIAIGSRGFATVPGASSYAFVSLRPPLVVSYADWAVASVIDAAALGSDATPTVRMILRAAAAFIAAPHPGYSGTAALADTAVLGQDLTFLLTVALEEGLVLADTAEANWTALARVMARLLASGHAASYVEALAQVLDTVVLAALADALRRGEVAETVVLSDAVGALYHAFARILERVIASDELTGTNTAFVLLRDSAALSGVAANTVDLVAALRDGAGFAANLSIDNGEYIAWVVNTEGDKPVSRYTQWPFNSMAKVGGRYMACDATGLHWMEGGDDSGEAIRARLRTGLSAMGTRRLKRVPEAFVAYRSDGTLLLWLIQADEETGEKVAGKFLLTPRPAQTTRENRFTPGRGWKAVEFDFIVENVDGADFDLTSLEFRPLYLDRRTRG